MNQEILSFIKRYFSEVQSMTKPIIETSKMIGGEVDVDKLKEILDCLKIVARNALRIDAKENQENRCLFIDLHNHLDDLDEMLFDSSFEVNNRIAAQILENSPELMIDGVTYSPFFIVLLSVYDELNGTTYSTECCHLLSNFALICIKCDKKMSSDEEDYLYRLNQSMRKNIELGVEIADGYKKIQLAEIENSSSMLEKNYFKHEVKDINENPLEEISKLIGIENVKSEVCTILNSVKISKMREEKGLPATSSKSHFVFHGNPGTGKTTVARLFASALHAIGALSKGHLIEVDRSGLVAGYVGQTAEKTKRVVEEAIGGVLFIDEAYTLSKDGNDFGQEAIDTLLKMMEGHRDNLVVIATGYSEKMQGFISSNSGLESRFQKFILFDDYSPAELLEIFKKMVSDSKMHLTAKAEAKVLKVFESKYAERSDAFGNARLARNLFQKAVGAQADRLVSLDDINEEVLQTIAEEDIF